MARFHAIWRLNPSAPLPADPSKTLALMEMMFAAMDGQMKKGEITDWGGFPRWNLWIQC